MTVITMTTVATTTDVEDIKIKEPAERPVFYCYEVNSRLLNFITKVIFEYA